MRTQNHPFRLTTTVAIAALLAAQTLPRPVLAQGAPPPLPQAGTQDQQGGDPPARVGRLAQLSGTVSFHTQDDTQWRPATLNYPVTQGDSFWTEPNAQAAIEVSAIRVAMAPVTELDVATLTDSAFQATEPQGELYVRARGATPDESYAVQTPRGLVTLASPGRYGVVAGDTQNPTTVTVIEGSAHVEGPGVSLDIGPDQTASITGGDTFQGTVGPVQRDEFLAAMLNSERPPQPSRVAPPPSVAAMPGGDDLAEYGSWTDSPQYGQVWYPQVASDWVPYREGRWAYVAPWGWTWVDSAPWGFAPFHYGRWAEIDGRWGWVPGGVVVGAPVPVYAPALVTFLGIGAVVGVGIGAALAAGRIGWCPLGPREPFHPWYHASDRYFRQVNITHVTNFTTINRDVTINNFANRGAATVVPTSAMTGSRPVAAAFQRVDPAQLARARPVIGQQPLRPASATVGVTPAVAHQLNLPPPTGLHAAPGPSFHATPAAVAVAPNPGPPALHPAVPAAAGARPFTGAPPLATPGGRPSFIPPGTAAGLPVTPHAATPAFATPGAVPPLHPGGTPGQPPNRFQSTTAEPGGLPKAPPPASPGAVQPALTPFHAPPPAGTPPAVAHTPPGAIQQAAPFHAPPPAMPHTPPGAIQQAAPFHASPPSPPSVVHTPPPAVAHVAPPPPPQVFHPAPPPAPVVHAAAPPPQFHPPPPAARAPPPPPQNAQHKRPGEP